MEYGQGASMKSYQLTQSLTKKRSQIDVRYSTNQFWLSPKLDQWTATNKSAIVCVQGMTRVQQAIWTFSLQVINKLQGDRVPVLWALPNTTGSSGISPTDLLKDLTHQAMRLRKDLPNESGITRQCAQFRTLTTESEWMRMLATTLTGLGPVIYIIIDFSILNTDTEPLEKNFAWQQWLQDHLFAHLSSGQRVKVLLLACTSRLELERSPSFQVPLDSLVSVRKQILTKRGARAEPPMNGRVRVPVAMRGRRGPR